MKSKISICVLVLVITIQSGNSHAWDTTAAKYYPLSVGNVYVYDYVSLWFNCDPYLLIHKYKVVIDDYVLMQNGKGYYKFSGWWGYGTGGKYQRIDSSTMNVYSYDSSSNSERLIDSLLVNSGNTFRGNRFTSVNPNATCYGINSYQILGTQRFVKGLYSSYAGISHGYSLCEDIGFLGFSACEVGSGSSYGLKGAIIDGVLYGDTLLTGAQHGSNVVPQDYTLSQNYPNPFNPNTIINYSIPSNVKGQTSNVKLTVFNNLGAEILTLVNEKQNPGSYAVDFNGENLCSGIYFYKLETGEFTETKRMILLK